MKVLCQLRNQVPVHVGRGRETVKEHNCGSILVSGFAVKHFVAIDVSVIVGSHARLLSVFVCRFELFLSPKVCEISRLDAQIVSKVFSDARRVERMPYTSKAGMIFISFSDYV